MVDFFPMEVVIHNIFVKEEECLENILFTLGLVLFGPLTEDADEPEV